MPAEVKVVKGQGEALLGRESAREVRSSKVGNSSESCNRSP